MNNNQKFIDSLRALADFLDERPSFVELSYPMPFYGSVATREAFADVARQLGHARKKADDHDFDLVRDFGVLAVCISVPREQVCRKIVKGTQDIPEQIIPAHTKDIVEWQCDEPILATIPSSPTETGASA